MADQCKMKQQCYIQVDIDDSYHYSPVFLFAKVCADLDLVELDLGRYCSDAVVLQNVLLQYWPIRKSNVRYRSRILQSIYYDWLREHLHDLDMSMMH